MAPIKKILFILLLWSSGISSSGVNSASMKALATQKENWNSRGSCDGNEEVFSFQPDNCACTESCIIHGDCFNGTSCQSGFMGCRCDAACADYGDCCATASANNLTTMVTAVNNYECVFLPTWGASLYAKGKCSDGWRNATVKNLCQETNANYSSAGKDPLLDTPVVSTANNVVYKNIFCAICNMEPVFNIKLFYSEVTCQFKSVSEVKEYVNISNVYFHENLHFINNNSWSLYIFGTTRIGIRSCTVKPIIPEIVKHKARYCEKFASTCSYNWTDHQIEKLCHYHTNLVRDSINGDIYRNYYCALCNFVDINDIECYHGPTVVSSTSPKSLSVLFVFNEKKSACDYSSLWDPFTKKCRHVYGQLMDRYQQPINLVDKRVTRADNYSIPESITELALREGNYATCAKMFLNESEFVKGPNMTIYVPALILTFSANEYELRNDGVYICRQTYTQISRNEPRPKRARREKRFDEMTHEEREKILFDSDDNISISESNGEDDFEPQRFQTADSSTDTESENEESDEDTVETTTDRRKKNWTWRKADLLFTECSPSKLTPILGNNSNTPLTIFKELFGDDIFNLILLETNRYVIYKGYSKTKPFTLKEIHEFFGILMWMTIVKIPQRRMYWSPQTRVPQIADVMSINRFEAIVNTLHLSNNSFEKNRGEVGYDPLYKVRPLIPKLNENFSKCAHPESHQSID